MIEEIKSDIESVTPGEAFQNLTDGNTRFYQNKCNKNYKQAVELSKLCEQQYPFAIVLSCMDSRVVPEIIFDQGLGNIITLRVAGYIVNQDILASIEYAVKYIGAKLVVVLGHTGYESNNLPNLCEETDRNIFQLFEQVESSVCKALLIEEQDYLLSDKVAYARVENSLELVVSQSSIVKQMFEKGEIGLAGGVFNLKDGKVDFFKNLTKKKYPARLYAR